MNEKKFYEEYYNKEEEIQNKSQNKRLEREFLLKFLTRNKNILDAGCGPGFETNFLHKRRFKVEGCDISKTGINEAKKINNGPKYFIHDFTKSPTKKKYEIIYSFDVIEHIFDYNSFLENIKKSLSQKGILLLSTPNAKNIENRIKLLLGLTDFIDQDPHIRFFTNERLKKIIEKKGFRVISFGGTKRIPSLGISKSKIYKSLGGSIFILAIKK